MSILPDTTSGKPRRQRVSGLVFAAVCLAALAFVAAASLGRGNFTPGEEWRASGIEDIAVSREDTSYPTSDVPRFGAGTEAVYVYLKADDLSLAEGIAARVERRARASVLSRIFGRESLEVTGGGEERLGGSGGVSGVVKFAVREESGESLPPGEYAVSVHVSGGGEGQGGVVARKYFAVGGWQD